MSFQDFSALVGLDQRQRDLLDLRSYYEETQYEFVEVKGEPVPARAWDDDVDGSGELVPSALRKPMVQLGTTARIVGRIVDLALGVGRFPTFIADDAAEDSVLEVLTDKDQLDLEGESPDQLTDLAVVGTACFGFSRPEDDDGFSRWEPVRIEAEWAEPVFAGARETPRGKELAAELSTVEGVELDGDLFRLPPGARSDDVVFVRHKWPVAHEVTEGTHNKRDVVTWFQVDYTADAIVEYEPLTVRPGTPTTMIPPFQPLPVVPHGWGVVPLVWLRMRGAKTGEIDGPSVYSPSIQSLTRGADRSASYWTQASHISGSPILTEIDVIDEALAAQVESGDATDDIIKVGPKSVRRYVSNGDKPSVSYLEIGSDAVAALKLNTEGLTKLANQRAGVPQQDPELIRGALSGVALDRMNEPSVSLVGGYRARLERGWLLLAAKLAVAMSVEGELQGDPADATFEMSWPRVFPVTAEDVTNWTAALSAAVSGSLVSRKRAVAKMVELLEDTTNPDDVLAEILDEAGGGLPTIPDEEPEPEEEPEEEPEA